MKLHLQLLFLLISVTSRAQYITEVIEYTPAPGQFINTNYGNQEAAQSIIGGTNGMLSLGAFGGYIIFKFANPVENNPENPYGIDFTIFGNASGSNAEPAIVSVMKDENNNGLPDDTWYELAGSNYFFSNTIYNYEITYTNPGQASAADVPWTDNIGNSGFIYANDYHTQTYYPASENFPEINQDNYTLFGTKISGNIDKTNPTNIKSYPAAFGCADNKARGDINSPLPDNPYTEQTEGTGGDAFDISWAVDQYGNYIDLDYVDFIKVHTAVNEDMAWLGEVSSEVSGAVDVAPDNTVSGIEDMVVIKDLPPVIYTGNTYQLERFAFNKGRLQNNASMEWSVNLSGTSIDDNNVLHLTQTGNLTVTTSLSNNPDISYSVSTIVSEPENTESIENNKIKIFPNPASGFLQISGIDNANVLISDYSGKGVLNLLNVAENEKINISALKQGIYLLKIKTRKNIFFKKVIIKHF